MIKPMGMQETTDYINNFFKKCAEMKELKGKLGYIQDMPCWLSCAINKYVLD